MPINESVKGLNMHLNVGPLSPFKWQLMLQFEESLNMHKNFMASTAESPGEEFKVMLLNTNPYLLIVTFLVTILHSVLDFMAFKNGN